MKSFAIVPFLAFLGSGSALAQSIDQQYCARWNVEPIVRFSIGRTMEVNAVHCRITSGPYEERVLSGRPIGVVRGRTAWQLPVSDLSPGAYSVTHDLRTPLGAEQFEGMLRVPQIARHTESPLGPANLGKWPQDTHARIAQDAGQVEFAWDSQNLYIRQVANRPTPVALTVDLLTVLHGKYSQQIEVNGLTAVPWGSLAPAGPHIGQVLRYRVGTFPEETDLLFAGSGENVSFGATLVGGAEGDDQGPPLPIMKAMLEMSGLDLRDAGIAWGQVENEDPGKGESRYDWTSLRREAWLYSGGVTYSRIGLENPWAEDLRTRDPVRYRILAERFVQAAAKEYASLGVKTFRLGYNEPEMLFRSDREAFFINDLNLISGAVRRAVPSARIIAGKFSAGDGELITSFYRNGFKDNFDILEIHPYSNDPRTGISMGEVILAHDTLKELGMGNKRIYLGEGWGPTRTLPQVSRMSPYEPVTPAEAEYHRQFYQNGYRELITPRCDYSPGWLIGATYFTLNDNVGGTYWKKSARRVTNAQGLPEYFLLDGLLFTPGDVSKPFFCNGGLIDFSGKPKGSWLFDFPPALPEVRVAASDAPGYLLPGEWHTLTVSVVNADPQPLSNVRLKLRGQSGRFESDISTAAIGETKKDTLAPGEIWTPKLRYRVNDTRPGPLRLRANINYVYEGEKHTTDDILRTEIRRPLEVKPQKSVLMLKPWDTPQTVKLEIRNNNRNPAELHPNLVNDPLFETSALPKTLNLAAESWGMMYFSLSPRKIKPGLYMVPLVSGSDESLAVLSPLVCPRTLRPPSIDGKLDDWILNRGAIQLKSSARKAERPPGDPFPKPPAEESSAKKKGADAPDNPRPDSLSFGADAALSWDDSNLYLAAAVEDQTFVQTYTGLEVWRQDSLQLACDPLGDGAGERTASGTQFDARTHQENYSPDDYEYSLALTPDGPQVARIVAPTGLPLGVQPKAQVAVTHSGGFTVYEAALPWNLLAPFKPGAGKAFRMDILVNNFEQQDRYTLEWSGALANGKYPSRFVPVLLTGA